MSVLVSVLTSGMPPDSTLAAPSLYILLGRDELRGSISSSSELALFTTYFPFRLKQIKTKSKHQLTFVYSLILCKWSHKNQCTLYPCPHIWHTLQCSYYYDLERLATYSLQVNSSTIRNNWVVIKQQILTNGIITMYNFEDDKKPGLLQVNHLKFYHTKMLVVINTLYSEQNPV